MDIILHNNFTISKLNLQSGWANSFVTFFALGACVSWIKIKQYPCVLLWQKDFAFQNRGICSCSDTQNFGIVWPFAVPWKGALFRILRSSFREARNGEMNFLYSKAFHGFYNDLFEVYFLRQGIHQFSDGFKQKSAAHGCFHTPLLCQL